jgi:hypothetical protein
MCSIQAVFNSLNFSNAGFGRCSGYLRGVPACMAERNERATPMCDDPILIIICFSGL